MDISSIAGSGLQITSKALSASQARFDAATQRVIDDTVSNPSSGSGGGDIVQDITSMRSEEITNSILVGLFRRQSEQQKTLVDMITGSMAS
jgi:hypothetical protein